MCPTCPTYRYCYALLHQLLVCALLVDGIQLEVVRCPSINISICERYLKMRHIDQHATNTLLHTSTNATTTAQLQNCSSHLYLSPNFFFFCVATVVPHWSLNLELPLRYPQNTVFSSFTTVTTFLQKNGNLQPTTSTN